MSVIREYINRMLKPIRNKIYLLISKAVIKSVSDVAGQLQIVQIDLGNDGLISEVERVQNFGFSSHPANGAQAVVACISGNREHPIVIAIDDGEYRPAVSEGDSVMYNKNGTKITLQGNKVSVDGDTIELGTFDLRKLVTEQFKAVYNGHTHVAPSGTTGVPSSLMTDSELTSKTKAG